MGILRIDPPIYLFVSLATIVVLYLFFQGVRVTPTPWNFLGFVPLAVGAVLNLMADRSFKKGGTSVKPLEESTSWVTTGVFRLSRHPMYLGFVLILLGAAILAGSATPFLVVAVFFAFMDTVFVRFEEKKLSRTFGGGLVDLQGRRETLDLTCISHRVSTAGDESRRPVVLVSNRAPRRSATTTASPDPRQAQRILALRRPRHETR